MRKYLLLSLVSVLSLSASDVCARDETPTTSCETLGYNTLYDDCVRENGMPLVCPFYSLDKKMVLCMRESCRGYSLTDADLDAQASDGKKVRDHIASTEECTVGFGEDAKTYYRVKECKSGSLYQNGICDVGCLQARYPYDKHPGDLPGEVEMCVDTAGKWYGYNDCNSGWVGGWKNNQTGKCEFATCSIQDYPYSSNPNINAIGEDVNRGAILTCKIGSSTYYRYTSVDKEGNPLTENVCGISNDYTLSRGVCRKQCVFEDCTNTVKTETLSGYTFSYNEFTCTQKTKDCRIGDVATINDVEIGMVLHLPNDSSNIIRIIHTSKKGGVWSSGENSTTRTPLPYGTYNGKYNSRFLVAFMSQNTAYNFPMFIELTNFAPSGCESIPVCSIGEWYMPAIYENRYIYDYRYILYNATNNNQFISGMIIASEEDTGSLVHGTLLSGLSQWGTIYEHHNKTSTGHYFPMLSFYVR